jgi:guanylate kinase
VGERAAGKPPPSPLLVVISGPSGAGKDAILDELQRRGHPFHRAITCTTRPPREGERDGVEYHFVTDAEFEELVRSNGLLEHAEVYGSRYGVPRAQVEKKLREGIDVYVRTDVQGAASIRRAMPEAVLVFVAPPSLEELERRIRGRGADGEAEIERRLRTARSEMERSGEFDHVIVNEPGRLGAAVKQLERVLSSERGRVRR